MDGHPDAVAEFMWGFTRSDGPRLKPWVEPVYRLRPRGILLTGSDEWRRGRIDGLESERQRLLICAAGRLLWRAAVAAHAPRPPDDAQGQARANAVGREVVDEMLDLGAGPRLKLASLLTRTFVGATPSMRQLQKHAKRRMSATRQGESLTGQLPLSRR
jgi:hypothetical protein